MSKSFYRIKWFSIIRNFLYNDLHKDLRMIHPYKYNNLLWITSMTYMLMFDIFFRRSLEYKIVLEFEKKKKFDWILFLCPFVHFEIIGLSRVVPCQHVKTWKLSTLFLEPVRVRSSYGINRVQVLSSGRKITRGCSVGQEQTSFLRL